MMKKIFLLIFSFALIESLLLGSVYYKIFYSLKHPFPNACKLQVEVKNGDNLYSIIDTLARKKEISNARLIKMYIKYSKMDTRIKTGSYVFQPNLTISKFVSNLNKGLYDENAVKITIPEGFNIKQIAKVLEEKGVISQSDFIQSAQEYTLPSFIKNDSKRMYTLEGFLFPDTYYFEKKMKGKDIIDMMVKRFEYVMNEIKKKDNKNLSDDDIDKNIILASMIEKEADKDEDRPKIASVFYNRLSAKMPLQSDVTVLYAYGVTNIYDLSADGILHTNKLDIKSPYNTYYVNTLPEGPICSPGRASIEAAINPDKTPYYYFVATKVGVLYSKTEKEHNDYVNKYINNK